MTTRLADPRPARAVITYGTFDRFDLAQARQLERICQMGTTIIVGVSTDELAWRKGEHPSARYADRAAMIRDFPGVDTVIPETAWEQRVLDLMAYDIDLLVVAAGCRSRCDHLADLCEIRYLDADRGSFARRTAEPARHPVPQLPAPMPLALPTWDTARIQPAPAANQPRAISRERLAAAYAV